MSESPSRRLASLDVFRGFTIAAMVLVNNNGSGATTYAPLLHASWNGWTFTDLVFPFFLWISGMAMTLSFAKRVEHGDDKQRLLLHVLRRAAMIFFIGLLLNGFPEYHLATLRIPGVLQRIAVCYLFASVIFMYTSVRGTVMWAVGLLLGYWALVSWVPVPGYGAGILEIKGSLEQYIDYMVMPGHLYKNAEQWDPEGIVSTLPAIATTLFGILAGHLMRLRRPAAETATWLFLTGGALMFLGTWWDHVFPINKNLWTSSYTALTAGLAFQGFAACYWLVDHFRFEPWLRVFTIFGRNAIVVYVFSGLFARMMSMTHAKAFLFGQVYSQMTPPHVASLLYALTNVAACFVVAWLLYRQNWFVRI